MKPPDKQLTALAAEVVRVLDKRAKTDGWTWVGFENGEGSEVGREIERLIRKARRILNQQPTEPHKVTNQNQ